MATSEGSISSQTGAVDLVRECRRMADRGLVLAAAGNASVATTDGLLITATGATFADLTPADLTLVDRRGSVLAGSRQPSSELGLHLETHRLPGIGAVMHTHGRHAVAMSVVTDVVPAVHYYCVDLGGPVPVLPYYRYGTSELAAATRDGLRGRAAVVLAHHGSVSIGSTLAQAAARSELLEWLCEVALLARAAGKPAELSAGQLAEVRSAGRRPEVD